MGPKTNPIRFRGKIDIVAGKWRTLMIFVDENIVARRYLIKKVGRM
jgi:hypothetical protein